MKSRSTDWLAPAARRQLPAMCTQVFVAKVCAGVVAVSTLPALSLTLRDLVYR